MRGRRRASRQGLGPNKQPGREKPEDKKFFIFPQGEVSSTSSTKFLKRNSWAPGLVIFCGNQLTDPSKGSLSPRPHFHSYRHARVGDFALRDRQPYRAHSPIFSAKSRLAKNKLERVYFVPGGVLPVKVSR